MHDDEMQHREPAEDVETHQHDLDAYMRERSLDPLNLDYLSWSRSLSRLGGLTDLGVSIMRRLRERLTNRRSRGGD